MSEQALVKMSEEQIEAALVIHPDWSELSGQISRTFTFDDFVSSMAFVNKVAEYAESAQHHPDMLIRYNKVTLTVSTHDANGITQKDFELAKAAEKILD